MFYATTDTAINRVTQDGVEYAMTYDTFADNPLESYCLEGFAITRDGRDSYPFDPDGTLDSYTYALDKATEAVDLLEWNVDLLRSDYGDEWWKDMDEETAEHLTCLFEDVLEYEEELKEYHVFTYQETGLYGWPKFKVVVDTERFTKAWGETVTNWQDIYNGLAKDYAYWAEGVVMVVGCEGLDEEEYTVSGVLGYLVDTDDKLVEYCNAEL